MDNKQFTIAVILISILIVLLIIFLILGFVSFFICTKSKGLSNEEIISKLDDLKKQTEANEYFRINGVISNEDYEKEKARILNEVEDLAEIIHETK